MHKITDKFHHHKGATQHSSYTTQQTVNPVLVEKTYSSNAQGAYVQAGLPFQQTTSTFTQNVPVQSTTFIQQPVQTTSFTQNVPVQSAAFIQQTPVVQSTSFTQNVPVQSSAFIQQTPVVQTSFSQNAVQSAALLQQQTQASSFTQNVPVQSAAFIQQTPVVQSASYTQNIESVHVRTLPTVVETRVRPAIVEQTVRIDKVTEIQPIVHREIEQPELHLLEKHTYEYVPLTGASMITNQAIVEETIRPMVVEQIQPIVHRSVPAPFIERVEEHSNEHIVQATTTSKQVLTERTVAAPVQISQQKVIGAPIVQTTTAAPLLETRTRDAIVEQTLRAEKITEIQPIVHREIEAPEIHLIEKHSYEKVASSGPGVITNQAIVEERITPHIVEQIQPIVHRSVPAPFIEKVEQHTNEKIVAPTQTTKEVLTERTVAAPVQISQQKVIGAPTVHHIEAAAVVENRTREAIVEQTLRPERITEIQPIVHREIEAPELHLIEKHSYEKIASSGPGMITNQPIVEERITPHIVEQIQPIVHRSVPAPFVEKVEQHTTEKIVAPTQTTKEVFSENVMAAPVQISQQKAIGAPTIHHTEAAAVVENRTREAIVQQTLRPERITEIQPIVHREIDAPEVHLIEKHSYEKVASSGPGLITNQAIVEERITPHIVEQIQPIVHRSVPAPFVEKVEQHTTEKIVAPTQTTKQVLTERTVAAPVQISQQKVIGAPTIHHTEAAAVVENRTRAAIVQQTARPERITEIQPIVHREIEAPELHLIEKHSYEKVGSTGPSTITRGAIVEETIIPRVIEEIQPIVHRNVAQTVVERVEQHTTEHIVAPTQTTKQVVSEKRTAAAVPLAAEFMTQASTVPIVRTSTAQTKVESFTKAALVEQTMRPEKITEVQPIVHRQIDAPELHLIEKHMYETVPSQGPSLITNQAIVQETVRPTIVEEIQPVVHRSVPAPVVERVEQHVTEHIVAPTVSTKEVIVDNHVRPAASLVSAAAAGVLPLNTSTTTTTTTTVKEVPVVVGPIVKEVPVVVEQQQKHGLRRLL